MSTDVQSSVVEDIERLLRSMGRGADDVADCLWLGAVRGVPGRDGLANPVVRFLHERLDLPPCDLTIPPGAEAAELRLRGRGVRVPLPEAVRAFLGRFHDRLHPELEAR